MQGQLHSTGLVITQSRQKHAAVVKAKLITLALCNLYVIDLQNTTGCEINFSFKTVTENVIPLCKKLSQFGSL
jgi:hypothetical protein